MVDTKPRIDHPDALLRPPVPALLASLPRLGVILGTLTLVPLAR